MQATVPVISLNTDQDVSYRERRRHLRILATCSWAPRCACPAGRACGSASQTSRAASRFPRTVGWRDKKKQFHTRLGQFTSCRQPTTLFLKPMQFWPYSDCKKKHRVPQIKYATCLRHSKIQKIYRLSHCHRMWTEASEQKEKEQVRTPDSQTTVSTPTK